MLRRFGSCLSLLLLAGLAGCGNSTAPVLAVDAIGGPDDPFVQGQRLPPSAQLVRAATAEGLVAFDAEGSVVPALADRWIVTSDGLSYIFRLRDGTWEDGSELTGETARDALRAALAGLKGTPLGQDLSVIAEVRAMAGRVVELRLSRPAPDLLDLLAQPELSLTGRGRGTGALSLRRKGADALLTPVAPERRGLSQAADWQTEVRPITLRATSTAAAVEDFAADKADAVLGGRFADYAQGLGAAGLTRRALRVDPVAGLFGLWVQPGSGALASPAGREALAMAIDRDALASDLAIPEWRPTTRVIPAGAAEAPPAIGERWTDMDMPKRRAAALSRLAPWTVKGGDAITVRVALPAGPGADVVWRHLQADFNAIGVRSLRVAENAPADLRLVDWVARYGRADWYLGQLGCGAARGQCSEAADTAAASARAAATPQARADALAAAEQALTLANVFIPLGNPIRWSLVREPLPGFAPNAWGWHPLSALATRPK